MLTDEDKREYMELMHEYADLMNDIDTYLARETTGGNAPVPVNQDDGSDQVQPADPTSSPANDDGASSQATFSGSDEDRLAELRAKLNI